MTTHHPATAKPQATAAIHRTNRLLERFSHQVTDWVGSSWAFAIAVLVIVVWAATGPYFNYNETWQLVINTGTTIVTFLMVFLIQRSQNKEALAVELKLNELLAAQQGASNKLINAEDLSEEEIRALHQEFTALASRLQAAADDCSPHSIADMHQAVHEMHQSLAKMPQDDKSKRRRATGKSSRGS